MSDDLEMFDMSALKDRIWATKIIQDSRGTVAVHNPEWHAQIQSAAAERMEAERQRLALKAWNALPESERENSLNIARSKPR